MEVHSERRSLCIIQCLPIAATQLRHFETCFLSFVKKSTCLHYLHLLLMLTELDCLYLNTSSASYLTRKDAFTDEKMTFEWF